MKRTTIRSILTYLAAFPVVIMFCWISAILLLLALLAGEPVYTLLILAAYIAALVTLWKLVCRKPGRFRAIRRIWMVWLAVAGMSTLVRESIRFYHASFEKIEAYGVDLTPWEPFGEGTRAVALCEPSTLTLSDSLPRLDGATAFYPVYAAFARAVYPEGYYHTGSDPVRCSTTDLAYERLIDGDADIIFVFGPSDWQKHLAEIYGVELVFTPIGREAFVFFVNSRNPVDGLSREQLRDIYSGRATRWSEVGGEKRKIRAFQRDRGSGSQTALEDFMAGDTLVKVRLRNYVSGMGPMVRIAADYANYPGAIGFSFRYFLNRMAASENVKTLAVDGVVPALETIRDGRYPLIYDFYAVTRADDDNPNTARLIEWILSEQGQRIIELTGYNPISAIGQ